MFLHLDNFSFILLLMRRSKEDSADFVEGPRFHLHENGSLEISAVEEEDMGEFSCIAKNVEGLSAITAILEIKGGRRLVDHRCFI